MFVVVDFSTGNGNRFERDSSPLSVRHVFWALSSLTAIIRHTNQNVPTSERRIDIGLRSTGEGRQDTLLRCQRCSIGTRNRKTSDLLYAGTNHRAGSECVVQIAQRFSRLEFQAP